MKTPNALFDLVRSMSAAEKGYFKKFVRHDDGKARSYIKLFDAINAQQEYDEDKLKKKFAKELSNFSAAKNYLYESIIDSLLVAQRQQESNTMAMNYLSTTDLLLGRNLFLQAQEYLEKVHQIGENIMEPMLRILAFDRQLLIASLTNNRAELLKLMDQKMDQALDWSRALNTDILTRRAVTWLNLYRMFYSGPCTKAERNEFLTRARQYISELEQLNLMPTNRISLEQLRYVVCEESGEIESAYRHVMNTLKLFELREMQVSGLGNNFVIALWNASSFCLRHYPGEALAYASRLEEFVRRQHESDFRVSGATAQRLRYLLLLRYYNQAGDYETSHKVVSEIKEWLKDHQRTVPSRILSQMAYDISIYYFAVKEYRLSIQYLHEIYSATDSERNTVLSAMLLEMMIHCETGDVEYIRRLIKPFYKQLLQYKLDGSFYQEAYACFTQVVRNPEPRVVNKLLGELLQAIDATGTDADTRNPPLMKILHPWLISKKDKSSFGEAVRMIYEKKRRRNPA